MRSSRSSGWTLVVAFAFVLPLPKLLICQTTVGIQPLGSYQSSSLDNIHLSDLGVHISIPLYSHKARGATNGLSVVLTYDTPGQFAFSGYSNGMAMAGWSLGVSTAKGGNLQITDISAGDCSGMGSDGYYHVGNYDQYTYTFFDDTGYGHPFAGYSTVANNCAAGWSTTSLNERASDGSGYLLSATGLQAKATDLSGTTVVPSPSYPPMTITDSNGNIGIVPIVFGPSPITYSDDSNSSVTLSGGSYTYDQNGQPTSENPSYIQYKDTTGTTQTITINYATYTVTVGVFQGAKTALIDSIVFSDNSSYHFGYQQSTCSSSDSSGVLGSVTLPTGGTITYQNGTSPTCPGPGVSSLTRGTADGPTTYSYTINAPTQTTTTVSHADGSSETINFVRPNPYLPASLETAHTWRDSSGVTIKSTMRCYNGASGNCTTTAVSIPVTQIATTTTLSSGLSSKIVESKNANGLTTEVDDYDYSASSPTRRTVTAYASLGNNIVNRPYTVTVYDSGSTNIFSQKTYTYDDYSPTPSGVSGLATVSGARGNLTSVIQRVSASASITTHTHYDDAGQVVSTTDGDNQITSYGHDSTDTYVTLTTYPTVIERTLNVSLKESSTPDSHTGLPVQSNDMNNRITAYTYDSMLRKVGICKPDGGYTQIVYSPTLQTENVLTGTGTGCTPTGGLPSGSWITSSTEYDGYGRTSHNIDPAGNVTDISYDSMGRKYSVSNPHASGVGTDGTVYYVYDSLGRVVKQTDQDGAFQYWCYDGHQEPSINQPNCHSHIGSKTGSWVDYQDETGKQWQRTTDALGRLVEVVEPNGSSPAASMETDYTYDPSDNLLQVSQFGGTTNAPTLPGPEYRYFTYDNLSRLIQSYNPESGWTCYGTTAPTGQLPVPPTGTNCASGYDGNDNVTAKTDARGVMVKYGYDALNRIISKSYFVPAQTPAGYAATSNVAYSYDESTGIYGNGRRTSMTDGAGSQSWVYDPVGRIYQITRSTITPVSPASSPQTNPAKYTYDLAGHLIKGVFFALGSSYQYSYDTTGRATGLNWNGTATYVSGVTYKPSGQLMGMVLGDNGTIPNKITETFGYNNRLQPASILASTSSTTLFNHSYCYASCFAGSPTKNNGNLIQDIDNSPAAANVNYSYDTLNRLSTAAASQSSPPWSESDTYDAYGNLYQKTDVVGGLQTMISGTSTAFNQLTLPGSLPWYDLAGNVRKDNFSTQFTWDAENRMATAGNVTYSYDGDGKRVVKYNPNAANGSLGSVYWYDADGSITDETTVALNGSNPRDLQRNFYFNGQLVARQGFPTSFYPSLFVITDPLGSSRVAVDFTWNGTNPPLETLNYLPFGGYVTNPPTNDTLDPKFTGKLRDGATAFGESGDDYFGARYYTSSMSRFMSPDWSDVPDTVPYADLKNPQSLNLYGYVNNNPLGSVDADGHMHQHCYDTTTWSVDANGGFHLNVSEKCQSEPDWWDFRANYAQFVEDTNARIDAHRAPQGPSNSLKPLQDITDIMMGVGPVLAPGRFGWRNGPKWRQAVKELMKPGTHEKIAGEVPTRDQATNMIEENGGTIQRGAAGKPMDPGEEFGHDPGGVSEHTYPHINYTTASGVKATVKVEP